jgi:hypothetical protein
MEVLFEKKHEKQRSSVRPKHTGRIKLKWLLRKQDDTRNKLIWLRKRADSKIL